MNGSFCCIVPLSETDGHLGPARCGPGEGDIDTIELEGAGEFKVDRG